MHIKPYVVSYASHTYMALDFHNQVSGVTELNQVIVKTLCVPASEKIIYNMEQPSFRNEILYKLLLRKR